MVSREPLTDPTVRPVFATRVGGQELPRTRVRHHWLRPDPAAGVWLGTAGDGLIRLEIRDGGQVQRSVLVEPGMDVQPPISGLIVRRDGTIWAGTASVVTFDSREPDAQIHTLDFDAVPPSPVGAFAERDDTLWAGDFSEACGDSTTHRSDSSGCR